MFKKIIALLLITASLCLNAETIYKTVDKEGNIIFTDKQTTDSEAIKLQGIQTIQRTPIKHRPNKQASKNETQPYKKITITNPVANASLRSNDGSVTISVAIEPTLRQGDTLIIRLDGQQIAKGKTSIALNNVDRGTHNIEATIFDQKNKTLISTSSNFSLLRAIQ